MALLCANLSACLGLVGLHASGAPARYLAINAAAWAIGVVIVGATEFASREPMIPRGAACLITSVLLLLVSLFGTSVDGVTRWISVHGVSLQPSFLVVPLLATVFARNRTPIILSSLLIVSFAIALQPDRSMAAALVAGTGALLIFCRGRGRLVTVSFAGAAACFLATWFRADTLPGQPFVEHVVVTALQTNRLAAVTSICGLALLIVPAIAGWFWHREQRDTYLVFASVWLALIAASILGNYPTPLVGYGSSAVTGYAISILALPRRGPFGHRS